MRFTLMLVSAGGFEQVSAGSRLGSRSKYMSKPWHAPFTTPPQYAAHAEGSEECLAPDTVQILTRSCMNHRSQEGKVQGTLELTLRR